MKNADKAINPLMQKGYVTLDKNGKLNKGLTKREYFAGQAMIGMLQNSPSNSPKFIAEISVKMADFLLNELEKPQKDGTDNS